MSFKLSALFVNSFYLFVIMAVFHFREACAQNTKDEKVWAAGFLDKNNFLYYYYFNTKILNVVV